MARVFTLLLLVPLVLIPGCAPAPGDEPSPADTPEMAKEAWTIGIYSATTPFDLAPAEGVTNPVLTGEDVTDFNADIAAHPFLVHDNGQYCLFFTAKYGPEDMGGIGLALSPDGLKWTYEKMVIKEPFVLSYPYVFKWEGDYYMIPEAHTEDAVRLYRATDFPREWAFEKELISGETFISASVVHFNDTWWMFVSPRGNNTLRLFYSSDLKGEWAEHPLSPIVENNPDTARPGGRMLVYKDSLYRMGQDCEPTYGNQVHAFKITTISLAEYQEEMVETPLVKASSEGWNSKAMHHVDLVQAGPDNWLAAVDALGIKP